MFRPFLNLFFRAYHAHYFFKKKPSFLPNIEVIFKNELKKERKKNEDMGNKTFMLWEKSGLS